MTAEAAAPSEPREHRLRRLRMRSWRRGMREMDLLLGPFSDSELEGLEPEALDLYESVLSENDQDLYLWVTRGQGAPEAILAPLRRIAAFHGIVWRS